MNLNFLSFIRACSIAGFLFLYSTSLFAQESLFPDLTGTDLTNSVVENYRPIFVLNYGEARDIMYGTIYNENDSVRCIYTGHTLGLETGADPSSFLWMNGSVDGINAEHTYPRSKGADEDSGNGFSDMHHLFPCRVEVNTSRNNFPFAEIVDEEANRWFYLDGNLEDIPTSNIDRYSERRNGAFEPRESQKGNIARAVFYFYTMYKEEAMAADPDFFELQRETLCAWHKQDPVDALEWERTNMIASYQNGLPNPFVIDATLVERMYCSEMVTALEAVDSAADVRVFPSAVVDWVNVEASGTNTLQVIDTLGVVIVQNQFIDRIRLDFSLLPSGTYLIVVNGKGYRVFKG